MVSRKVFPMDGAVTFVVVVVFLVPTVLTAFKDTFMKRCLAFKEKQAICDKAWKLFEDAYEGKDPKEVTADDYKPLFDEIPFTHPCEKTLLYSNTRDVVHKFIGKGEQYITIWETLLGKAVGDDKWCGKKNSKETFTGKDCESSNPVSSFWEMASIKFAEYACKVVTVLLKGKEPGDKHTPYYLNSYLARFEVPKLNPSKVKKLVVFLIVDEIKTQCNDKSLDDLKNVLKGKGISYECKEVLRSDLLKCKGVKPPGRNCCSIL